MTTFLCNIASGLLDNLILLITAAEWDFERLKINKAVSVYRWDVGIGLICLWKMVIVWNVITDIKIQRLLLGVLLRSKPVSHPWGGQRLGKTWGKRELRQQWEVACLYLCVDECINDIWNQWTALWLLPESPQWEVSSPPYLSLAPLTVFSPAPAAADLHAPMQWVSCWLQTDVQSHGTISWHNKCLWKAHGSNNRKRKKHDGEGTCVFPTFFCRLF